EIVGCHDVIAQVTGMAPRYFRPPWGMVNAAMWRALRRIGERCVFWSLQPEGLTARTANAQTAFVLDRVRAGAIVDFHDAEGVAGAPARLLEALPAMIDGVTAAGLRFATVGELLNQPRTA